MKRRCKDKQFIFVTVRICPELSASVRIYPKKVLKLLDYIKKNAYLCSEKNNIRTKQLINPL